MSKLMNPCYRCFCWHDMTVGINSWLGGGNSNLFWNFHPETWGRWTHFDSYFSNGLKPPTRGDPNGIYRTSSIGGCFKVFWFVPLSGERIQFDLSTFFLNGLVQPATRHVWSHLVIYSGKGCFALRRCVYVCVFVCHILSCLKSMNPSGI